MTLNADSSTSMLRLAADGASRESVNEAKETLLALIEAGHSVNALPDEYAQGGSALHALARMLNRNDILESVGFENLVTLIEVGADPCVKNRAGVLPQNLVKEEKRDQWIGVVNAVNSRIAAHAALHELGLDTPDPKKKAAP